MNFEHLRLFVRVAATRNMSKAGLELGLSPAVASSYINKLEEDLGVRLVHRTTRKISLTEEGVLFLPCAEDVLNSVEHARTVISTSRHSPTGNLRITAPASFGRQHLVPGLKGFLDLYPELSVDLNLSDDVMDIVGGGFDLAIRNANLKDSTLIARLLAEDRRIVCASPEYLARFGEPKSPQDLKHHDCVVLTRLETWSFETRDGVISIKASGRMRSDNGDAMRDATVGGLGISVNAVWGIYQHLQQGRLVEILKEYPLASNSSIWAVYPSARQVSPKVKAFIDYYRGVFGSPPYWEKALE